MVQANPPYKNLLAIKLLHYHSGEMAVALSSLRFFDIYNDGVMVNNRVLSTNQIYSYVSLYQTRLKNEEMIEEVAKGIFKKGGKNLFLKSFQTIKQM